MRAKWDRNESSDELRARLRQPAFRRIARVIDGNYVPGVAGSRREGLRRRPTDHSPGINAPGIALTARPDS